MRWQIRRTDKLVGECRQILRWKQLCDESRSSILHGNELIATYTDNNLNVEKQFFIFPIERHD